MQELGDLYVDMKHSKVLESLDGVEYASITRCHVNKYGGIYLSADSKVSKLLKCVFVFLELCADFISVHCMGVAKGGINEVPNAPITIKVSEFCTKMHPFVLLHKRPL